MSKVDEIRKRWKHLHTSKKEPSDAFGGLLSDIQTLLSTLDERNAEFNVLKEKFDNLGTLAFTERKWSLGDKARITELEGALTRTFSDEKTLNYIERLEDALRKVQKEIRKFSPENFTEDAQYHAEGVIGRIESFITKALAPDEGEKWKCKGGICPDWQHVMLGEGICSKGKDLTYVRELLKCPEPKPVCGTCGGTKRVRVLCPKRLTASMEAFRCEYVKCKHEAICEEYRDYFSQGKDHKDCPDCTKEGGR